MEQSIQEWTKWNLWKTAFKSFYLVLSWMLCPIYCKLVHCKILTGQPNRYMLKKSKNTWRIITNDSAKDSTKPKTLSIATIPFVATITAVVLTITYIELACAVSVTTLEHICKNDSYNIISLCRGKKVSFGIKCFL